jgi:hypothetical protein
MPSKDSKALSLEEQLNKALMASSGEEDFSDANSSQAEDDDNNLQLLGQSPTKAKVTVVLAATGAGLFRITWVTVDDTIVPTTLITGKYTEVAAAEVIKRVRLALQKLGEPHEDTDILAIKSDAVLSELAHEGEPIFLTAKVRTFLDESIKRKEAKRKRDEAKVAKTGPKTGGVKPEKVKSPVKKRRVEPEPVEEPAEEPEEAPELERQITGVGKEKTVTITLTLPYTIFTDAAKQ